MNSDLLKSTAAALFLVLQATIGFIAYVGADEMKSLRASVNALNQNVAAIVVRVGAIRDIEQDVETLHVVFREHISTPNIHASGLSRDEGRIDVLTERVKRLEDAELRQGVTFQ